MKQNKGFTLIEMLVVVGMIGVLAAAVLTALGPSRQKARDTRIISAVNQVAALVEAKHDGTSYNSVAADTAYTTLSTDVTSNGGTLVTTVASTTFVVSSKLASDATKFYCVDNTGVKKTAGDPGNNPTKCP